MIKLLQQVSRIATVAAIAFVLVAVPLQPPASSAIKLSPAFTNAAKKTTNGTTGTNKTTKVTAPKISITSPANNAVVSGTQTVTVTATDSKGIASVQYQLDGVNLGSVVTAAPYSFSWDTTTTTNASHKLTAIATNTANLTKTSKVVTITVNNPVVDPNPAITVPTTAPTNTSLSPTGRVSFTFDDGLASTYTNALPILSSYGLTGTDYVITGCVDMVTAPNTCHANTDTTYMSWQQIEQLQNAGWEIGSHTVTHPYLATSDATDGQPNVLTPAQVTQELTQSRADLAAHGINATDISTPYGDYNNATLAEIAKYYATQRGFADQNNNDWGYTNDYIVNDFQVEGTTTVAQVEAKIDDAIANNRWLVLTFHNIMPNPSTNPDDYEWGTAQLDQVAAYVKAKQDASQIQSIHVNQGITTSDTNLLQNASFNDGISNGWTTDAPSNITLDTNNNGSYPDPTNSVKLTSLPSGEGHLFSQRVPVSPGTTYMIKSFLNVQTITSGSVGFYVDEYDANGTWISGQYLKAEPSAFVEEMSFLYRPSSANVTTASLQIIVGGIGINAYIDNVQWFPTGITPTPPPTPTNLVVNGTFDSGIAGGWTTDAPSNITADSANNGSPSNPVNSVKMVAGTSGNTHLFSPKVTVDSTKQYNLTCYLNLKAINSGEVAFYIDEYDANGNWISGQYKAGVSAVSAKDVSFNYIPSSANVKSASLQVIVVGNSGITAYVDDIRWYQN
ncbi:MAG TPA: polysaccharide deacetylase family protein [Candidatus Saccharimonadales bacterium]|nr:polysaccharide deacetylase family protein [Candidatus Saccharimonadales bacterium]